MRIKLAVCAVVVSCAAAVVGCGEADDGGIADESAEDLVVLATEAMRDLKSVHVEGNLSTPKGRDVTLDLSMSTVGNCSGTVGLGGGSLEVLQVDGDGWYRADAAYWQAAQPDDAAEIIRTLGDSWVVADGSPYMASFCELDSFLDGTFEPFDRQRFEKGDTDRVGTEEVVEFKGNESSSVYVATDDPHYILKLAGKEGQTSFSDFDEDIEVEAPAEEDTVTLQ